MENELKIKVEALQMCLHALAQGGLSMEVRSRTIQVVENTLADPATAERIAASPGLAEEIRRVAYLCFGEA